MVFDLDIIGFGVGASDSEKIHQSVLEDGKACKPDKENIPHANKGRTLNDLETAEKNVIIVVIIHNHDHISNHAQCLQNVKDEAKEANIVDLVSLDDHTSIMITRCIRCSVFVFL